MYNLGTIRLPARKGETLMKTIGLVAGVSWESSVDYYRILNEEVSRRIGGLHSAKIAMYSVDLAEVEAPLSAGRREEAAAKIIEAGVNIQSAGADFFLICSNTMGMFTPDVEKATGMKGIFIADAVGKAIRDKGMKKLALLGTRFTMEGDFYKNVLIENYGLEPLVPDADGRKTVDDIIWKELCLGVTKDESRDKYVRIIEDLAEKGAECVALSCTEIPLLIQQEDVSIPVFDSTRLHSLAAVEMALAE
jgi:aspartate racemase